MPAFWQCSGLPPRRKLGAERHLPPALLGAVGRSPAAAAQPVAQLRTPGSGGSSLGLCYSLRYIWPRNVHSAYSYICSLRLTAPERMHARSR